MKNPNVKHMLHEKNNKRLKKTIKCAFLPSLMLALQSAGFSLCAGWKKMVE